MCGMKQAAELGNMIAQTSGNWNSLIMNGEYRDRNTALK